MLEFSPISLIILFSLTAQTLGVSQEEAERSAEVSGKRKIDRHDRSNWLYVEGMIMRTVAFKRPHAVRVHEPTLWYIEDLWGKVMIKKDSRIGLDQEKGYMTHDGEGEVTLAPEPSNSTIWTPHKHADGSWSFESSRGLWLHADGEGKVTARAERGLPQNQSFWITDFPESEHRNPGCAKAVLDCSAVCWHGGFTVPSCVKCQRGYIEGAKKLKSAKGTYLSADADGSTVKLEAAPNATEHWHIMYQNDKVILKSSLSEPRYLRSYWFGEVNLASRGDEWEEFKPQKNTDGTWSFEGGFLNKWLKVNDEGKPEISETCDASSKFTLEVW